MDERDDAAPDMHAGSDDDGGEGDHGVAGGGAGSAADEVGPPVDLDRRGDPARGWPRVWQDEWDDVINTGLTIDDVIEGALVEVWYRGYWWRATVFRIAWRDQTVEIRWLHSGAHTSGYRITLVRRPVPVD